MRRVLLRVLVITVALGAAAPVAMAQTAAQKKQAKQHFDEGKTLFNLAKFREAIAEFERSYRLFTAPEILFMIGQCHNQLGEPDKALFYYRRYLAEKPNAKNREEVEAIIAEIEAKAGRRPAPVPAPLPLPPPPKKEPAPPPPPKPKAVVVAPAPVPAPAPAPTPAPSVAPAATTFTPTPVDESAPIYKKWWFWSGIGAAVVTVVVIGVAASSGSSTPAGGLGTIDARGAR
jgi:iron complex outermembrane receptor protein